MFDGTDRGVGAEQAGIRKNDERRPGRAQRVPGGGGDFRPNAGWVAHG
jgi:hypothetical protein